MSSLALNFVIDLRAVSLACQYHWGEATLVYETLPISYMRSRNALFTSYLSGAMQDMLLFIIALILRIDNASIRETQ